MNWEAIGIVADIVEAAAIILTLGFLTVQVKGEKLARRAQTREEFARARRNSLEMILRYPELGRARNKSRRGEKLTQEDRDVLFWYVALYLRDFENSVYQYDLGSLDVEEFDRVRELANVFFRDESEFNSMAKNIVNDYLPTYSERMIGEMQSLGLLDSEKPLSA